MIIRKSVPQSCWTAHSDTHYTSQPDETSHFGVALKLRRVCWLESVCELQDVPAAVYTVLWRLRHDADGPETDWDAEFSINGVVTRVVPKGANEVTERPHEWCDLQIGRFEGGGHVKTRMFGHNGHWCGNLSLDCVAFVPTKLAWCHERFLWLMVDRLNPDVVRQISRSV